MGFWSRLFPVWQSSWRISVAGRSRLIHVEWDTALSGGGRIDVDGVPLVRWRVGIKGLATARAFTVDGARCEIRKGPRTWGEKQLDLFVDGIREAALP